MAQRRKKKTKTKMETKVGDNSFYERNEKPLKIVFSFPFSFSRLYDLLTHVFRNISKHNLYFLYRNQRL